MIKAKHQRLVLVLVALAALTARREHPSPLVREHVAWALERHGQF